VPHAVECVLVPFGLVQGIPALATIWPAGTRRYRARRGRRRGNVYVGTTRGNHASGLAGRILLCLFGGDRLVLSLCPSWVETRVHTLCPDRAFRRRSEEYRTSKYKNV